MNCDEALDQLLAACGAFFSLPNWQNRVGPWQSENQALNVLHATYAACAKVSREEKPAPAVPMSIAEAVDTLFTTMWTKPGIARAALLEQAQLLDREADVLRATAETLKNRSLRPPEPPPAESSTLDIEIERLRKLKTQATDLQDYPRAACIRDEINVLLRLRDQPKSGG